MAAEVLSSFSEKYTRTVVALRATARSRAGAVASGRAAATELALPGVPPRALVLAVQLLAPAQ